MACRRAFKSRPKSFRLKAATEATDKSNNQDWLKPPQTNPTWHGLVSTFLVSHSILTSTTTNMSVATIQSKTKYLQVPGTAKKDLKVFSVDEVSKVSSGSNSSFMTPPVTYCTAPQAACALRKKTKEPLRQGRATARHLTSERHQKFRT